MKNIKIKYSFILWGILFLQYHCFAQCPPTNYVPPNGTAPNYLTYSSAYSIANYPYLCLNIKDHFGAIGNGTADDHEAFKRAATFIDSRGGAVRLYIPDGTYKVGKQLIPGVYDPGFDATPAASGETVFRIGADYDPANTNSILHNVIIEGQSKTGTKIIWKTNQHFGSFQMSPVAFTPPSSPDNFNYFTHGENMHDFMQYNAEMGYMFEFSNCDNLTIKNLDINGNMNSQHIGANWGDFGIQGKSIGIRLINTINTSISDLNVHDFCLDAIYLANPTTPTQASHSVNFSNVTLSSCGRNCFCWGGGDDVIFTSCEFLQKKEGAVFSLPKACFDFEAETFLGVNTNGLFNNCTFQSNTTTALNNFVYEADNMEFNNCKIIQLPTLPPEATLTIKNNSTSDNWNFNDCEFYGTGLTYSTNTSYNNCLFQNRYNGEATNVGTYYLLEIQSSTTTVSGCTFNNYDDTRALFINGGNCSSTNVLFENTTINSYKSYNRSDMGDHAPILGTAMIDNLTFNYYNYQGGQNANLNTCGTQLTGTPFSQSFCIPNLYVNTPINTPAVYKAESNIKALSIINLSSAPSSSFIKYVAGDYVEMLPGFEAIVSSGSYFEAYTKPCSTVTNLGRPSKEEEAVRERSVSITVRDIIDIKGKNFNITCYPNPVTQSISINVNSSKSSLLSVDVYDVQGNKVRKLFVSKRVHNGGNVFEANLSSLQAGTYLLSFNVEGEKQVVKKIVKL